MITIRKFAARPYTVDDLVGFGTATAEMFDFLRACVEARLNIFVSGGTGSGKTTTLNVLSSFIPDDERIITIEDAAELQLRQEHVVTLEARPPNLEGQGEITIRDLLRNALHMRPDRIIVGECRARRGARHDPGHDGGPGGLALHRATPTAPPDMLRRLETMVLMAGYELPLRAIREQIASAVDLIVHTARLKDGSRKVVNITEVYGIEDDEILTQDIFAFEQTGMRDGKIEGHLKPTGIRPTFMGKFKDERGRAAAGRVRHPRPKTPRSPARPAAARGGWVAGETLPAPDAPRPAVGYGRAVTAGGMVYVSSMGPVDPETGQVVSGDDQGPDAPVPAQPEGEARGRGQLAREGRLGQLVAARPGRVRRLQRGVGALVPRRRAGRPGHADAAAAAPRRLPGLDRGHRRGVALAGPARRSTRPGLSAASRDLHGTRRQNRPAGRVAAAPAIVDA